MPRIVKQYIADIDEDDVIVRERVRNIKQSVKKGGRIQVWYDADAMYDLGLPRLTEVLASRSYIDHDKKEQLIYANVNKVFPNIKTQAEENAKKIEINRCLQKMCDKGVSICVAKGIYLLNPKFLYVNRLTKEYEAFVAQYEYIAEDPTRWCKYYADAVAQKGE